ncbi:receptor like protein kinase S.2 isoform X2 [Oryza brachyantha]|uniref:receptor like protein kinase S.2 isoform X2 n=1 Tax=Oryza brachyantha TaxID=4533 RepID=UPI000776994B|nr:receptor like protein kinase S.2 isoform X2 [Oryza brachyantha]
MSLPHLCFVLPMDADEVVLAAAPGEGSPRGMRGRSKLASYVRGNVGRALRWLRCSFCGCGCGAEYRCHDSSGVGRFEDIAGVYDFDARKLGGGAAGSPRIFSYSELYIGTNGFSDKEILGSGGFGRVYRAVLPSDGTTVAVKCVAGRGDRFEKSFLAELLAVARLRHRNLVRLRGWCVQDEEEMLLVYDYMPNRSLDRHLFGPAATASSPALSWERRRCIVSGLAAALFYLHEQLETQIVHRDVKTSNVMLDSEYNARLGDFGLARWIEHAMSGEDAPQMEVSPSPHSVRSSSFASANYQFRLMDTSRIGGTIGYLPPESFQRRAMATVKSDVFSFGIVLLEVVTGRRAVDLAYPDDQIFMLDWVRRLSDQEKLIDARDRKLPDGSYPLSDMGRLIHLGLLCSLHDPRSRPSMKWVVENLSGNCPGDLPPLPPFLALPKYVSLTSSSDSGTTTNGTDSTVTSMSKLYCTAEGTTIYLTAENGGSHHRSTGLFDNSGSSSHRSRRPVMVAELDFGTGYEGFLDIGYGTRRLHVLVKRLGMKTCPALRVRFANELRNLAKLQHRNLVQLRGWCTEHGEMLVVYDYSPGNLLSHQLIRRDGAAVLSWRHRYNILKALASAVLYLHEEWDEQVIHRNITSAAVFLDPDRNPRLGSFALAEFLSRNESHGGGHHRVALSTTSARGIFGYMSPEYMETGEANAMADVYSFGVVVLEVVTGKMAVDVRSPEVLLVRKVQLWKEQSRPVEAIVDRRLDGQVDRQELERLVRLGIACTQSDPSGRPSMRKIVSIMDGNDEVLMKFEHRKQSKEEWESRNAAALSLVRRLHALAIH